MALRIPLLEVVKILEKLLEIYCHDINNITVSLKSNEDLQIKHIFSIYCCFKTTITSLSCPTVCLHSNWKPKYVNIKMPYKI